MAKFLSTTATSHYLEEMIKKTKERLILISPYLKTNARMRDILEDLDRYKTDIRVVYGKSELQPEEMAWLEKTSIRTSFCQNLHAKCYLNESQAIITSMNLYEFSQVNNREMGMLVIKEEEPDLYREIYDEAQSIIRSADEIKVSVEHVAKSAEPARSAPQAAAQAPRPAPAPAAAPAPKTYTGKLISTTQLAKLVGTNPKTLFADLHERGWIDRRDNQWILTRKGEQHGGQLKHSKEYGDYLVWPEDLDL